MDKERLERIVSNARLNTEKYLATVLYEDIEWLASTVEEQQREIEGRKDFESRRIHQVKNLIEQNKRYRDAIEKAMDVLGQPGMTKMTAHMILDEAMENAE